MEFGQKAQLVEGDDGVIVDHNAERGNPADAPQLALAVDYQGSLGSTRS